MGVVCRNAGWLLLTVLVAYGLGQWLGRVPMVVRLVTSPSVVEKVTLCAGQAFNEHGLHNA